MPQEKLEATLRLDIPLKETLAGLNWQGASPRLKSCLELGDERMPVRVTKSHSLLRLHFSNE